MTVLEKWLTSKKGTFYPVVPFDPAKDKLLSFDFTAANGALTADVLNNTSLFCEYINEQLVAGNALYGIGGYAEHRTVYIRSRVFDAAEGDEPRRLHLGTDIWGRAGTEVAAPMDGKVHSFAFNDRFGDYGATIILAHETGAFTFYTLYGHLNLQSLATLEKNKPITKGTAFAALGEPKENGHWPPHLHFQLIDNLGDWEGDYPGVCAFSQKEKYLANSPDPDLILQMNQYS